MQIPIQEAAQPNLEEDGFAIYGCVRGHSYWGPQHASSGHLVVTAPKTCAESWQADRRVSPMLV